MDSISEDHVVHLHAKSRVSQTDCGKLSVEHLQRLCLCYLSFLFQSLVILTVKKVLIFKWNFLWFNLLTSCLETGYLRKECGYIFMRSNEAFIYLHKFPHLGFYKLNNLSFSASCYMYEWYSNTLIGFVALHWTHFRTYFLYWRSPNWI